MEGLAKLGLDWTALGFYLLNFGVIVFVLAKWVYKPLIKFLESRRKIIEQNLEQSKVLQEEFARKIKEKEQLAEQQEKLLKEKIEQARTSAQEDSKKLLLEAEAEKQRIIEQAKSQADQVRLEAEAAIEDKLLEKVTQLVIEARSKNTDPEDVASEVKKAWNKLKQQS